MGDGGWDACFTEMWNEEWSAEGLQPPFYGSCPCRASVHLTQSFRIESTPLLYLPRNAAAGRQSCGALGTNWGGE